MEKVELILGDIRSYVRSMAVSAVRPAAAHVLDEYEKALVYEKLDPHGKTTGASLEQTTKIAHTTISDWMSKFTEAGIAAPPDDAHRGYRALFTLQELGISLSTLKRRAHKSQQPEIKPVPVALEAA
jgi:hypothetical protein